MVVGVALACVGALPAPLLRAGETTLTAPANRMAERSFPSEKSYADPFNDLDVDVVFTAPDGQELRVPAFWAGGRTWTVRYASGQVGVHRYRTECSDTRNAALHGLRGRITIKPYTGDNPLYCHGPIGVAADRRHFRYADGTPFLWLGDTWWMGLCQRLHWPDEFKTLAADRRRKGFNVVQIVAGLYPDMPAIDERGLNEAGFPWEKDYSRINPKYFDAADRRLFWLADAGLSPCLVGAWGYHLPWLKVERMKKHWRYLIARYGALPVTWCIAGEVAMPYYLSKKGPEDRDWQRKGWTEVAAYVRRTDPYHRLITVHPTDSSRTNVEDVAVLDFDMLQTGHSDRASIANTIRLVRGSRAAWPTLPTVVGEVCYEGILDTCFDDVQRFMVWSCLLSGTAGHTYGANGIWQVNRRDKPYGASPHGGNWGTTPWDDAMKLPGSRQVGLAKALLDRYPWQRFEPHPEWASVDRQAPKVRWGDWIWYPEGNPARDAPTEARYFRRTFELPQGCKIERAVLWLTADDKGTAYLNGKWLGTHMDWRSGRQFAGLESVLRPGKNVLAVLGENLKAPVAKNPAGLSCSLDIELADGQQLHIASGAAWRCSKNKAPGWRAIDFDEKDWPHARRAARYGDPPWGSISVSQGEFIVPYAAGIPKRVRIIYLPTTAPVTVHHLERGRTYAASYFDPVSGKRTALGTASADGKGSWTPPAPPSPEHDWVLVLEAQKKEAAAPVSIHPENPRYFLFRGKPLVLVTASEHYGSVINRPFDFKRYLKNAAANKQTLTRTFLLFREQQASRNPSSPAKPESPDFITPYPRTGPGKALDGEPAYDLDQWNPEYFQRLHRFLSRASKLGIVVELTLFSNTYGDGVWALNPLRAENNKQGIGKVAWPDYNSLKNKPLVERQLAYAQKIIVETSRYDNVYYEICNEPGGGVAGHATTADVDAWQKEVARVVRGELKRLRSPHLVFGSQAFTYAPKFGQQLDDAFSGRMVDVVNVHPLPDTSLGRRAYQMGNFMSKELQLAEIRAFCLAAGKQPKPTVLDEDNCASQYRDDVGWTIHRKRAWTAVLSGAHYDYIDFSITVGSEAGTKQSRRKIRRWMRHLSEFIHSFDFIHAKPLPGWVSATPAAVVTTTLAVEGKDYVAYLADAREVSDPAAGKPISGKVSLALPAGSFLVRLYSPTTGQYSPAVSAEGGKTASIELLHFRHDLVIRATRSSGQEEARP
ncbi:MAG TPA: DUF4038 domain-containing protein [Gemmataceae bacterium]|nr:DUF4038 domain-containing protein [Gemmataceae bacterium]